MYTSTLVVPYLVWGRLNAQSEIKRETLKEYLPVLHWMTGLNQNLIRGTCVRILNRFVYYGRRVLRKLPADSGLSNYRVVTSEFS